MGMRSADPERVRQIIPFARAELAKIPGMIPIVNSMMVVVVVSLPGMMTGQVISGMDPVQAVRYQIVIMFLIAGATALGTVSVVLLSVRRLFDPDHRFKSETIHSRPS